MSNVTWKIDPAHSQIEFRVKHMVITTVRGEFKEFDGEAVTNGDELEDARIHFTAQAASVSTHNEQRDTHLKSDDFFNAEKFPQLTFQSTSFEKDGSDEYTLKGDLTIRDKTHSVTLKVEHGGTITDSWGNTRAGFTVTGKVSRKDYDLRWNALLETGQAVVSDEVKLNITAEFVKQT